MYSLNYANIWRVFEAWAQEGKLGEIDVDPHRVDGLDQLIHNLFGISLEDEDIPTMTVNFERIVCDKEVEWILSEYAWTLYKAKEAKYG